MVETDALINGFFSFVIPGLGQVIEGYKKRGVIFFLIAVIINVILLLLNVNQNIIYAVEVVIGLIAAYDAIKLF